VTAAVATGYMVALFILAIMLGAGMIVAFVVAADEYGSRAKRWMILAVALGVLSSVTGGLSAYYGTFT